MKHHSAPFWGIFVSALSVSRKGSIESKMPAMDPSAEPWRKRLHLPNYPIGEAARYTHVHANTVAAWHRIEQKVLTAKEKRARLSYLQLIELAVVAAFRKAKFPLPDISAAREYLQKNFNSAYPFAEFKFKHYGRSLFAEDHNRDAKHRLFKANAGGQLAWDELIDPVLKEFDYEHQGIAVRWHLAGVGTPIIIDPRISFGAPSVRGTPTWIIKGRYDAGETDSAIAEDFHLGIPDVRAALKFEGVIPGSQQPKWFQ
jgi:uncharacterized protein (DUF433 family)/DNA-binding transcriptional MerR regulator